MSPITHWTISVAIKDQLAPGAVSARVHAYADGEEVERFEMTHADPTDLMSSLGPLMEGIQERRMELVSFEYRKKRMQKGLPSTANTDGDVPSDNLTGRAS